jgi:hypothetical protein
MSCEGTQAHVYGRPALDAGNDHVGQCEMVSVVVVGMVGSVCATTVGVCSPSSSSSCVWGAANDVCGSDDVGDSVCVGEHGWEVQHIPTDKDTAGRSEAVSVDNCEWEAEAYRDAKSAVTSASMSPRLQ